MRSIIVLGKFKRAKRVGRRWLAHHFREWLWQHGVAIRSNADVTNQKPEGEDRQHGDCLASGRLDSWATV